MAVAPIAPKLEERVEQTAQIIQIGSSSETQTADSMVPYGWCMYGHPYADGRMHYKGSHDVCPQHTNKAMQANEIRKKEAERRRAEEYSPKKIIATYIRLSGEEAQLLRLPGWQ